MAALLVLLLAGSAHAQYIRGTVTQPYISNEGTKNAVKWNETVLLNPGGVQTKTDSLGRYIFGPLKPGKYEIALLDDGNKVYVRRQVMVGEQDVEADISHEPIYVTLDDIEIRDLANKTSWQRAIEGMSINAARKTEVIHLDQLNANLATNNARQVFSRIAGLNIWENDGGGLQLGIGGRGLSPNRSSNFNTRQNGYDIAADALGYPESYYTPPTEALERIEVVRGAAALQYGTQFGGMVNFQFKQGPQDKKIQVVSRQTVGSWGFFNSFNSVGGTVGKLNYYAFYQGKRSDGWRENSGFHQHTAYGSLRWAVTKRIKIGGEYTFMRYLAQQSGGLTDAAFVRDPRQSIRDRNWFQVNWNLAAITADVDLGPNTRLNLRNFGLHAQRDALGFLGGINRVDPGDERNLITGAFNNCGNETRLLHKFDLLKSPAALLVGGRYYQGLTTNSQGFADAGDGPNFTFLNPEKPEQSDYQFPSRNIAAFAEQLINLGAKWSVAPGIRYEYIHTGSEGSYTIRHTDLAGNLIYENTFDDQRQRRRSILLAGLGTSFKPNDHLELYGNITRNYRAITFSDMQVVNPNFVIDPNLKDEKGFNADLGFRGRLGDWFSFDMSAFYLRYSDRIGQVLMTDTATFNYYRFRTNVADSRNIGLEWYAEADLLRLLKRPQKESRISLFTNFAWINARYTSSQQPAFDGKWVELVPRITFKSGVNFKHKGLHGSAQWSYTAGQYSDATNAKSSPNAVEGYIPAYQVMDVSLGYTWKWLSVDAGSNNALNQMYFTRRAVAYPGPGIIPSDGRSFYTTVQVRF